SRRNQEIYTLTRELRLACFSISPKCSLSNNSYFITGHIHFDEIFIWISSREDSSLFNDVSQSSWNLPQISFCLEQKVYVGINVIVLTAGKNQIGFTFEMQP